MATFTQLDAMIRQAYPDSPARRQILTALHSIEEGHNQCLGFHLATAGFTLKNDQWVQAESTRFQVQT